jgi:hypothetical protein
MSDMPSILHQGTGPRLGNVPQRTYSFSGHDVSLEGRWLPNRVNRLAEVRFSLHPKSMRSEAELISDWLIQHYLSLLGDKLATRLERGTPVVIDMFRLPSYDNFLSACTGRSQNDLGKLYAECRGARRVHPVEAPSGFPRLVPERLGTNSRRGRSQETGPAPFFSD